MCRRPVHHLACTACHAPISDTQVLVYADATGREGPAVDPFDLECYLRTCDQNLPSNDPILNWAHARATEALNRGFLTT